LKDVSFEIKRGESVGIIGRNGAGKSTLLKLLSRITEPTTGRIELDGKVASLLEVGTGFHPELTGRENIYLNGAILGMKRAEIRNKFDEIVAFAEVEKFLDTPVKHYSSGMYVRLAFAVAAHLEPDVLIVDEVLAVGDAEFQKKCLGKMQSVSENDGRTVLFVSHNMQAIRQMCQRVIFLKQGRIAHVGDPHVAISTYLGQGVNAASHAVIDLTDYPRTYAIEGAAFQRIRFTDGRGRPVSCVGLTDVLGVEMDINVKKSLRQFNLSMAMVHGEGLRVFSEAYSDQHAMPDLVPGDYTLRFNVPMRFFKMESYFLTLAMNENGKHCDQVDGLLMPEIIHENPNLQMESLRWGVLRVPVTWDLIKPGRNQAVTGGIHR
jgi:lipopolysaccharide transport system ATP-binding protein